MPESASTSVSPHPTRALPRLTLGLFDAITLIVGVVIGAGIFKSPALVAGLTGSVEWMFSAWILGGVVSLVGALCYAELTTAYSHAGGDYHFLVRAYGRSVGFLFGWARLSVITTGSIALLAFVFGDYLNSLIPLAVAGGKWGSAIYAAACVIALTSINLLGIRAGSATQTWLTVLEVLGLLAIVAAAVLTGGPRQEAMAAMAPSASSFGLAMVFVLLTFGGWNEGAYISAEVRDGKRNMVRALAVSIVMITLLYLLVVWAFWKGLGMATMAKSGTVATDLMRSSFGASGERFIAFLVLVSAVTSINATMIAGARTSYALACDWPILGRLAVWDARRDSPATAMQVQCVAALCLLLLGGLVGNGFKSMVEFTAPVFWLFFLLSGLSLIVLRMREPQTLRPFHVPFYPLLPLLFCATCGFMLWSSLSYVYSQELGGWNAAWIGVAVLFIGIVLLLLMRRLPSSQPASSISPDMQSGIQAHSLSSTSEKE